MKHFGIAQWVDFARGVTPEQERSIMREHLATGCLECRQVLDFYDKFARVCLALAPHRAPEAAVRNAWAIFPIRWPDRPKRAVRIPIELIYDSCLVPAPAGKRASWQVGWQGLYRAGDCSLDLRIEPELKSSRTAVIGQVTNHVLPELDMGNLPVSLRAGKVVVAETLSNRFGEFQMEYAQQPQLQLCINLPDSKSIRVPLKRFISDPPAAKSRTSSSQRTAEKQ